MSLVLMPCPAICILGICGLILIHYALSGQGVVLLLDFTARPWLVSGELMQIQPGIATQTIN